MKSIKQDYIKIIKKALLENRKKNDNIYYEKHHILPKALFPLWEKRKSNIVLLTAKEHVDAHKLLAYIYGKGMWCAYNRLIYDKQNNTILSHDEYAELREKHSEYMSELNKGRKPPNKGKPNPGASAYMKNRIITDESIKKRKETLKDKNYHWWTNGEIDTWSNDCPGENYKRGRTNVSSQKGILRPRKKVSKFLFDGVLYNNVTLALKEIGCKSRTYLYNRGGIHIYE